MHEGTLIRTTGQHGHQENRQQTFRLAVALFELCCLTDVGSNKAEDAVKGVDSQCCSSRWF